MKTYKHGGFHRPPLQEYHGPLTHPVQSASDPAQGEQYVQGLAVSVKAAALLEKMGNYHCKHHQRIIPPERPDNPETDETSQTDGNEGNAQKDGGDDEDRFASTFQG